MSREVQSIELYKAGLAFVIDDQIETKQDLQKRVYKRLRAERLDDGALIIQAWQDKEGSEQLSEFEYSGSYLIKEQSQN